MAESEQRFATRLNSFRSKNSAALSVEQAVRAVAEVPGVSAVELNYPQHFTGDGNRSVLAAAADALAVSRSGSSAGLITRRDIDQFLGA